MFYAKHNKLSAQPLMVIDCSLVKPTEFGLSLLILKRDLLAALLTIDRLSAIIPPVYSEEEEQYPPRGCKENPWTVKRGERTAANTPWS